MDAQQDGGQLKVHEENDDSEVDERMGSRNQIGLLVQHENDGGHHGRLGVAELGIGFVFIVYRKAWKYV